MNKTEAIKILEAESDCLDYDEEIMNEPRFLSIREYIIKILNADLEKVEIEHIEGLGMNTDFYREKILEALKTILFF